LPPLLGCLVIIPYFLWGKVFGGYLVGFTGSLLGLTAYIYYYRSKLGWFDTDILNVFFILLIPYFLLLYSQEKKKGRYLYLILALILSWFFLWWWPPSRYFIGFLVLIPLFLSIFFFKRGKTEAIVSILVIAIIAGVIVFKYHLISPAAMKHKIMADFAKKEIQKGFPIVSASISEYKSPGLSGAVDFTVGHISIFILSILSLLILMLKKYKEVLFLSVPLVLGLFGFIYAQRFLIFFVPFMGLGLGYGAYLLFERKKQRYPIFYVGLPIAILLVNLPNLKLDWQSISLPKMVAPVVAGLDYIDKNTPQNALVWCWWDLGWNAEYWANRAVFMRGGFQAPRRTFFTALPLATSNWYLSANMIKFFGYHDISGFNRLAKEFGQERAIKILKAVLSAPPDKQKKILKKMNLDPDKWETFFFPKKTRKIYLVLDKTLPEKAYWWYYFGSWDMRKKEGTHPTVLSIKDCEIDNYKNISPDGLRIKIKTGPPGYRGKSFFVKELVTYNSKTDQMYKKHLFRENGLVFEIILPSKMGFLVSEDFYKSIFNKLFILNSYHKELFKPVFIKHMFIQVWEVL